MRSENSEPQPFQPIDKYVVYTILVPTPQQEFRLWIGQHIGPWVHELANLRRDSEPESQEGAPDVRAGAAAYACSDVSLGVRK